jgi:iron(II)-dependent oxidoreductase
LSSATPIRNSTGEAPSRSIVPAERAELLRRLDDARRRSDDLFQIVRAEALYDRPIPERHRIIFYVGHLEAFDWNLMGRGALDLPTLEPAHDRLFAFGIDPVDGQLPSDQPADWPALAEVRRYVTGVREKLDSALNDGPAWRVPNLAGGLLLHVAVEHRLMHAETLAYMFHQLPYEKKYPWPVQPIPKSSPVHPRSVQIPAGHATLGRRRGNGFGWDNEFDEHTIEVPAFSIDAFNVTNAQFLEFLRAGGYDDRSLWSDADWEWKQKAQIRHPGFWLEKNGQWFYRGMFREIPLPLDCPVYTSHAEASAYARWLGKSLPTEAQFHRAACGTPDGSEREFPWGNDVPSDFAALGNFDFQHWDPVPVGSYPAGQSAFGVFDLLGNGWEWTSTVFTPFEGFERFPFYPGYSADFFGGKHFVMKGGSPRTAACMLRRSFRNWFQGHYPYVYATFRCVEG